MLTATDDGLGLVVEPLDLCDLFDLVVRGPSTLLGLPVMWSKTYSITLARASLESDCVSSQRASEKFLQTEGIYLINCSP